MLFLKTMRIGLLLFLFLCISASDAKSKKIKKEKRKTPPTLIEKLQKKYDTIQAFKAHFTQETNQLNLNTTKKTEGFLYYLRPGKFKWESADSIITSNGKKMWVYSISTVKDIPSQVVIIENSKNNQASTILYLVEKHNELLKNFSIKHTLTTQLEETFELIPKKDIETVEKINIVISKETKLISALEIYDSLGNRNKINLSQFETNPQIPAAFFTFIPPRGTNIVQMP